MAKNKMMIQFDGIEIYRKQLEQLGGGQAVKRAFDEALEDTQTLIAEKVTAAMSPHNDTGKVKESIITNDPPKWAGDVVEVSAGFDIVSGGSYDGLPSIFLMYGTQLYGQPHIQPDRNLYNAVYGTAVRKQVREIQEKAFTRVLNEVMNE